MRFVVVKKEVFAQIQVFATGLNIRRERFMIRHVKSVYRRTFAAVALLGTEMLLSIILFLIAFLAFVYITRYIFVEKVHGFDDWAFHLAAGLVSDGVTNILLIFTFLGSSNFLLPANLLLTAYFLLVRHKWYSIKIPAIALSSVTLMHLLKMLFNRSRPLTPLLEAARGLSFPSGHAMSSVTFYGLIIYFIWNTQWRKGIKAVLITSLVLIILLIGFSRIYLRVHYASDVIGGYSAGVIWLILSVFIIRKIETKEAEKLSKMVE